MRGVRKWWKPDRDPPADVQSPRLTAERQRVDDARTRLEAGALGRSVRGRDHWTRDEDGVDQRLEERDRELETGALERAIRRELAALGWDLDDVDLEVDRRLRELRTRSRP